MKKLFTAASAAALMSLAGLANAAEPLQLTDSQMDNVSAGQSSSVSTGGTAVFGTIATGADTGTLVKYRWGSVVKQTSAGGATMVSGFLIRAGASAGSSL